MPQNNQCYTQIIVLKKVDNSYWIATGHDIPPHQCPHSFYMNSSIFLYCYWRWHRMLLCTAESSNINIIPRNTGQKFSRLNGQSDYSLSWATDSTCSVGQTCADKVWLQPAANAGLTAKKSHCRRSAMIQSFHVSICVRDWFYLVEMV